MQIQIYDKYTKEWIKRKATKEEIAYLKEMQTAYKAKKDMATDISFAEYIKQGGFKKKTPP